MGGLGPSAPLRRKKKPAPSLDAWVPISRDLIEELLGSQRAAFSVFSLFVVLFFVALVVVARRRLFALWGNHHGIWVFWRTLILLLGKRTRRNQTANRPRHYFSFYVEHRISIPPHARSAHGRESKRCAGLNRARTVPEMLTHSIS